MVANNAGILNSNYFLVAIFTIFTKKKKFYINLILLIKLFYLIIIFQLFLVIVQIFNFS